MLLTIFVLGVIVVLVFLMSFAYFWVNQEESELKPALIRTISFWQDLLGFKR